VTFLLYMSCLEHGSSITIYALKGVAEGLLPTCMVPASVA